jgi:hypothetical protein
MKYIKNKEQENTKLANSLSVLRGKCFNLTSRCCKHLKEIFSSVGAISDKANYATGDVDRACWGPSASEGPQKHDLTKFLEYNA